MNLYDIEYSHFVLNETRGIVDNYYIIGDEIFSELSKIHPILISSEKGLYLRSIDHFVPKNDCFIQSISVKYYTFKKDDGLQKDGGFKSNEENVENLSKNNKLINCELIFFFQTENPLDMDYNSFMDTFSHEVEHAYKYYSVLSKNNSGIPQSVKQANKTYHKIKQDIFSKDEEKTKLFLQGLIYLLDTDETNAFANQTYEYIRQHTYLNRKNVFEHFKEFRMYRSIEVLKLYFSLFDKLIKVPEKRSILINVLNKIYDTDYTNAKGIRLLRQRLSSKIVKASNQFIKVVEKALMDFNRVTNEDCVFNELEIILEEFNKI